MRFIWPVKADYRIAYLTPEYGQTVIARENRDYVWITARAPQIPDDDYQRMLQFIGAQGYDLSKIRLVPQRWESDPEMP
jgi:apolipoprotein D and lipocalin family protein